MKIFKKLKSSSFWVSMISAVVLILQAVFNVDIKTEYLSQIIMAMLGVLVMTGIVSDSPNNETQSNKDLSIDKITQSLGQIFTQTIANMETNMLSVISQFEKLKESFTNQENVSDEQNKQAETKELEPVENVERIHNEEQSFNITQTNEESVKIDGVEQSADNVLVEQSEDVQVVKISNLNVL